MANCLVTVSGTTGTVLINYIDSGAIPRVLTSGPGTFLIDDGGSEYTWTNLSGDTAVSSLCIEFTEIVNNCYIFSWELTVPNQINNLKFTSVELGTDSNSIADLNFPFTKVTDLAAAINGLNLEQIKAKAYKVVRTTKTEYFMILKVQGTDIPFIKIKNIDSTHFLYLKGVYTSNCLPAGYTEIETCEVGTILT